MDCIQYYTPSHNEQQQAMFNMFRTGQLNALMFLVDMTDIAFLPENINEHDFIYYLKDRTEEMHVPDQPVIPLFAPDILPIHGHKVTGVTYKGIDGKVSKTKPINLDYKF